jgi:triacylglycerol esterase/lipase EstA (alpha/beta hydrolase family)
MTFNPDNDANWATALTYLNMPTNAAYSNGVEQPGVTPGGDPGNYPPGLNGHQKEIFFNTFIMYVANMVTLSTALSGTTFANALKAALYSALVDGNRNF